MMGCPVLASGASPSEALKQMNTYGDQVQNLSASGADQFG
jgi:hypothetical protein